MSVRMLRLFSSFLGSQGAYSHAPQTLLLAASPLPLRDSGGPALLPALRGHRVPGWAVQLVWEEGGLASPASRKGRLISLRVIL